MYKRRNEVEKEIADVVRGLYEYGTDFPGKIAQTLYELGYRREGYDTEAKLEAEDALADYARSQPNDYERAYAEPLAQSLRRLVTVEN